MSRISTDTGFRDLQVARKFEGSEPRKSVGRPRIDKELEDWVIKMAKENHGWGYDRIASAVADLGYDISDQTVGNILKRRGIPPVPERRKTTTWREFIHRHLHVLWATDFFSTEVWTLGGLVTFYVLFFIKLATRRMPGNWHSYRNSLKPITHGSLISTCGDPTTTENARPAASSTSFC